VRRIEFGIMIWAEVCSHSPSTVSTLITEVPDSRAISQNKTISKFVELVFA
jgi:hypothetical protein